MRQLLQCLLSSTDFYTPPHVKFAPRLLNTLDSLMAVQRWLKGSIGTVLHDRSFVWLLLPPTDTRALDGRQTILCSQAYLAASQTPNSFPQRTEIRTNHLFTVYADW